MPPPQQSTWDTVGDALEQEIRKEDPGLPSKPAQKKEAPKKEQKPAASGWDAVGDQLEQELKSEGESERPQIMSWETLKQIPGGALAGLTRTATNVADVLDPRLGPGLIPGRATRPRYKDDPLARRFMGLGETPGGRIGYGMEQAGEQIGAGAVASAIPGLQEEYWYTRLGRPIVEALTGGGVTLAQTGDPKQAAISGALGGGVGAISELARAAIPETVRKVLTPFPKKVKEKKGMEEEVLARITKPGAEVPLTKAEVDRNFAKTLEPELQMHKARIDFLTKDPNSPFAAATIPIDDLLKITDNYIKNEVQPVFPDVAKRLTKDRNNWAKQYGWPKRTEVSLKEAQEFKEKLSNMIKDADRQKDRSLRTEALKYAEAGHRAQIEKTVTGRHAVGNANLTLRQMNHVMEVDLRAKESIIAAIKRNPQILQSWPWFLRSQGAAGLAALVAGAVGGPEAGKHATEFGLGAEAVGGVATLVMMMKRNPQVALSMYKFLRATGQYDLAPAILSLTQKPYTGDERSDERTDIPATSPAAPSPAAPTGPAKASAGTTAPGAPPPRPIYGKLVRNELASASVRRQVPPGIVMAVAQVESSFNPDAIGPSVKTAAGTERAVGPMQLLPSTAQDLSKRYGIQIDPYNVKQNIDGGALYLNELMRHYKGDIRKVLTAYNWGSGHLDRARGDVSKAPPETQDYVERVLSVLNQGNRPGG